LVIICEPEANIASACFRAFLQRDGNPDSKARLLFSIGRICQKSQVLFAASTQRIKDKVNDMLLSDLFLKAYLDLQQEHLTSQQAHFIELLFINKHLWQAQHISQPVLHFGANSPARFADY
jgi:hypothetical protein